MQKPMEKRKSKTMNEEEYAHSLRESERHTHLLKLYVTGTSPQSMRAIANIKKICEEHLKGQYELEVIDLYQRPQLARGEQIIAAPTLVKKLPLPLRKLIGDMSDAERVLVGLDLKAIRNK